MKNALIIHGICTIEEYMDENYPSLSNSHWFPWLQKQLLIKNILTQTPEMPEPYRPNYAKWKKEFDKYYIDKNSILIGHSCGAGFLVTYLSQNKKIIDKLILVAPWMDPGQQLKFFNFNIDPTLSKRVNEIYIFISSDDSSEVLKSFEILTNIFVDAKICKFSDQGHFTFEEMNTDKFPELLEII